MHYAIVDGADVLRRALEDPSGYGEALTLYCDVLCRPPEPRHPLRPWPLDENERALVDDAVRLLERHPALEGLWCDLDRQYDALAYVLAKQVGGAESGTRMARACRGGDHLGSARGVQGHPWRCLDGLEVSAIAADLVGVDADAFAQTFASCWHEMKAVGVYKAAAPDADASAVEEWSAFLCSLLAEMQAFYREAALRGFGVLTRTD